MKMRLPLMLSLLLFAPLAAAQEPPAGPCSALIKQLAATKDQTQRTEFARRLASVNEHASCLTDALLEHVTFAQFLKTLESTRTDKQSGASAGTGGSTNLVSKGTTAKILSIAAEYGALTETVNKQIITVQGSFDAVPAALVRQSLVPYCPSSGTPNCINRGLIDTLRRFSYGISLDTSQAAQAVTGASNGTQGAAQPVTFTAEGHAITAVTFRAVLWNARDIVSKTFVKAWKDKGTKSPEALEAAKRLLDVTSDFAGAVTGAPGYASWFDETIQKLTSASGEDAVTRVWDERLRALVEMLLHVRPDIFDLAMQQRVALGRYTFEEGTIIADLQKPVATLQYDYKRPADHPPTSTLRMIFDKGLGDGWSFAANAAVEFYDQKPASDIPGAGRVRDAQAGIQFQKDLGTVKLLGAAALAGTYYYQRQISPSILDVTPGTPLEGISLIGLPSTAKQVFSTKGDIHVVQARLVLGPSGSSARFPFSITYSNRTELIAKPTWRAQIGVSYDFDSLFVK